LILAGTDNSNEEEGSICNVDGIFFSRLLSVVIWSSLEREQGKEPKVHHQGVYICCQLAKEFHGVMVDEGKERALKH
jgi:hypothetical protein